MDRITSLRSVFSYSKMADTKSATPEQKSKRPKDTKFKQQKLPAWQPILTAGTVIPAFFAIGLAFIPLGIALLITSNSVQEFTYDYTQCIADNGGTCASQLEAIGTNNTGFICKCEHNFTLGENFEKDVYMYYGLSNYYQNHRRYVRSRDDSQIHGDKVTASSLLQDCEPFRTRNVNGTEKPIAPCGAIANSLFNDSFVLYYLGDNGNTPKEVTLIRTGIAWLSDKEHKFNNPEPPNWSEFAAPPSWPLKAVWQLDNDTANNGYENEDLIVWMRTAALPTFRKLYRRISHETGSTFASSLPKGTYKLQINYAYPVTSFEGKKMFILSNTSWIGGKNQFLGIAYIVVGGICIVMGGAFVIIHFKYGKKLSETININSETAY